MPKRIGIVDVTTVGSTICQRMIASSSEDHPEFIVHSLPLKLYKAALLAQDWVAMSALILRSIESMKWSCDFVIIPSNTPHYHYEQISKASPLPVLNLITLTAEECARLGYKKVAVLGTMATMKGGLYSKALAQFGITSIEIPESICVEVNRFILEEIIPERISSDTVERIKSAIEKLPCDALILGCTELPEVYGERLSIPSVDTTRLLARKAVEYATDKKIGTCLTVAETTEKIKEMDSLRMNIQSKL